METDAHSIEDFVVETTRGQTHVLFALILALQESGALPAAALRVALESVWAELPEEAASGDAGAVIEQVLDRLDGHASTSQSRASTGPEPLAANAGGRDSAAA